MLVESVICFFAQKFVFSAEPWFDFDDDARWHSCWKTSEIKELRSIRTEVSLRAKTHPKLFVPFLDSLRLSQIDFPFPGESDADRQIPTFVEQLDFLDLTQIDLEKKAKKHWQNVKMGVFEKWGERLNVSLRWWRWPSEGERDLSC